MLTHVQVYIGRHKSLGLEKRGFQVKGSGTTNGRILRSFTDFSNGAAIKIKRNVLIIRLHFFSHTSRYDCNTAGSSDRT